MMTYATPRLFPTLVCAAVVMVLPPCGATGYAQTATETKIRLMAEALRVRDAGDLGGARDNLRQLLALAPDDTTVQRLLENVEARMTTNPPPAVVETVPPPVRTELRHDRGPAEVPRPPPPSAPVAPLAPGAQPAGDGDLDAEAEALAQAETERLQGLVAGAQRDVREARALVRRNDHDAALTRLDGAGRSLPVNPFTVEVVDQVAAERSAVLLAKAEHQFRQGDVEGARATFDAYERAGGRRGDRLGDRLTRAAERPGRPALSEVSPEFVEQQRAIAQLIAKGRAQYLGGDTDGAQETFREVEGLDPDHPEAKNFLRRIAQEKAEIGALNREKTRAQMLEEVAKAWQRPGLYVDRGARDSADARVTTQLSQRLEGIVVPSVSFSAVDLTRVVSTLSDLSVEYDPNPGPERGVNIVVIDPQKSNPSVSITLRNLSLKRVLDVITDSVGYQYEVQSDLIVVRPGGETSTLDTAFFPVTRSTVIRMTGLGTGPTAGGSLSNDPFASPPPASPASAPGGEGAAVRAFLQQAGVNFDGVPGSSLAYDGSAMIVTQTTRNIERIRNILNRYNDVRQVEIEAKFMEVQEGALEELGVQWGISRRGVPVTGPNGQVTFVPQETYTTTGVNRSLAGAFANTVGGSTLSIESPEIVTLVPEGDPIISPGVSRSIPFAAPAIPGSAPLGALAGPLANITGVVGEFDVNAVIRALSQKAGSDLLSAPKVTVLSGNPAHIVVAQELRYPQSYGEIQSQVGSGTRESSAAGVTITAGTPQEFTHRNVGVELQVTPTVEEDDYSISLDLAPKVTEFEGFVEYGGTSVAISQGTTVTVPSGFYQPIFSVRELTTKVTIWDGATLVMGGLTREEVKKVHDKVPILGDIPLIGRAFRSQGESSQKRNLLIFVTANLVSPGGSPKNQNLRNVTPSSMFQNPTIVTPASSEPRVRGN